MKRKFIFCLLLCIGVATTFGQKSEVKVSFPKISRQFFDYFPKLVVISM
jgi:hypothetical protein